uniref:Uncharacterized protein n=1 Tax=Tetranychus urticae TaxID=32264 RepID=T1KVV6_TETUR
MFDLNFLFWRSFPVIQPGSIILASMSFSMKSLPFIIMFNPLCKYLEAH